jgi:hypothetical protein
MNPLSPVWIVGFVGQRDLGRAAIVGSVFEHELRALAGEVSARGGRLHFVSKLADASDIAALEIAVRLQLPVHVILPQPPEILAQGELPPEDAESLRSMLAQLSDCPHSCRIAASSQQVPEAYFESDVLAVEACDFLLAASDGLGKAESGGLAAILTLAERKGVPTTRINVRTGEVTIATAVSSSEPVDPIFKLLAERGIIRIQPPGTETAEETLARVDAIRRGVSNIANRDARWFRHAAVIFVLANLVAAGLGAVGGVLSAPRAAQTPLELHPLEGWTLGLGFLELGAVLFGLWFKLGKSRRRLRDEWVQMRFAAEVLRSVRASATLLDPLYPPVAPYRTRRVPGSDIQVVSDQWRRFALTFALEIRSAELAGNWQQAVQTYVRHRLHGPAGQIQHYRERGRVPPLLARFEVAGLWFGWAAAVVLVISVAARLLGFNFSDLPVLPLALALLPAALPLLAALPAVLMAVLDYDRRRTRYRDMEARLIRAAEVLPTLCTPLTAGAEVLRVETMLLEENFEWYFSTSRLDPN